MRRPLAFKCIKEVASNMVPSWQLPNYHIIALTLYLTHSVSELHCASPCFIGNQRLSFSMFFGFRQSTALFAHEVHFSVLFSVSTTTADLRGLPLCSEHDSLCLNSSAIHKAIHLSFIDQGRPLTRSYNWGWAVNVTKDLRLSRWAILVMLVAHRQTGCKGSEGMFACLDRGMMPPVKEMACPKALGLPCPVAFCQSDDWSYDGEVLFLSSCLILEHHCCVHDMN